MVVFDHRHAGLLTCDGIVAARDPHFFSEHGIPHHRPEHLLLFEADAPDHVEDVSAWVDLVAFEVEREFITAIKIDGDEYMILGEDDILAVIEG